ncbi:hypothetical protein MOK15_21635 [Sphingobium sp. BYY-5]|uniref:hypothetical protein n=1 Tax=Sphingobium sp. BYY-5 TaxID=2926400 RepID=UPI001FA6BEB0|nr:hypothetical protein [Sphingobium sp. BYY-5]MCI4592663.1 hypothetical protein [Sphingobium sp. BYY-5]
MMEGSASRRCGSSLYRSCEDEAGGKPGEPFVVDNALNELSLNWLDTPQSGRSTPPPGCTAMQNPFPFLAMQRRQTGVDCRASGKWALRDKQDGRPKVHNACSRRVDGERHRTARRLYGARARNRTAMAFF